MVNSNLMQKTLKKRRRVRSPPTNFFISCWFELLPWFPDSILLKLNIKVEKFKICCIFHIFFRVISSMYVQFLKTFHFLKNMFTRAFRRNLSFMVEKITGRYFWEQKSMKNNYFWAPHAPNDHSAPDSRWEPLVWRCTEITKILDIPLKNSSHNQIPYELQWWNSETVLVNPA